MKIPPPDPRDLAPADVAALLAAAPDERGRLVVLLMVHCGLRCVDVSRARVGVVEGRDEDPRPAEPRRGEWFIWRMPRRVRVISAAAHRGARG